MYFGRHPHHPPPTAQSKIGNLIVIRSADFNFGKAQSLGRDAPGLFSGLRLNRTIQDPQNDRSTSYPNLVIGNTRGIDRNINRGARKAMTFLTSGGRANIFTPPTRI